MRHLLILSLFFLAASCSESGVVPDGTLGEPEYDLPRGEPGSLDALIYEFHERYGTFVLYDFPERDIRWEWRSSWRNFYVPVAPGNERYVQRLLTFLQDGFFGNYSDKFLRMNLKYKIFMVERVYSWLKEDENTLVNLQVKDDGMVLGGCGTQMDDFTEEKWAQIRNEVEATFITGLYKAAAAKPLRFEALRPPGIYFREQTDPEGIYPNDSYTFYSVGYVRGKDFGTGRGSWLAPEKEQDFADFIVLLIQTPRTQLTTIMTRFDRMRERTMALVPYLNEVIELDVVATQNLNCPDDPLPAGFFENFK